MDLWAVRDAVAQAGERARSGEGPTFLNCKTYRYYGHSMSDKRLYRTREEEQRWLDRDPITLAAERLIKEGIMEADAVAAIEEDARVEMEEAVAFAQSSPDPTEDDLRAGVFASQQGGTYVGTRI
jgi:TPP-dependent pyruvate/acetoin dehydrogenase alpha subunit